MRHIGPPRISTLWVGGTILLWLAYAFVFTETLGESLGKAVVDSAANVIPLSLLAAGTRVLLRDQVMNRTVPVQAVLHAGLAIFFAVTWYALILVSLGFLHGIRGYGFSVTAFSGPAFTWQVFQGLVLYFGIAATCYAIRGGREASSIAIVAVPPLERYLTRSGEEMVPISVRDIVTIKGAQDYSEVATIDGACHLVRMSLGEFENRLDANRFVRVHRSALINFDHLVRTEPAGSGRLVAQMVNGDSVQVSRAGAQTLRSFVV